MPVGNGGMRALSVGLLFYYPVLLFDRCLLTINAEDLI